MKLVHKLGALIAVATLATLALGAAPASAAHYQGGDFGTCIYPTNQAVDGVYVEAYGLGADVPRRNATVAARAIVVAAAQCVRKNSTVHVARVQVDKVAVRWKNVNYRTVGPVNKHNLKLTVDSGGVALPCGQYAQSAVRWSVRYSNGGTFSGYLNSGGFRRC